MQCARVRLRRILTEEGVEFTFNNLAVEGRFIDDDFNQSGTVTPISRIENRSQKEATFQLNLFKF